MKKILLIILSLLLFNPAYANIKIEYEKGIYHAILTGDKIKKQLEFISSANLRTNKEAHYKSNSIFTINAGFFDPKNQKTVSYIVND